MCGKCPGGRCPRGKCPGGVCPWGKCLGVLVRGGGGSFCPVTDTVLLFEGVCTYLNINVRMLKVETLNLKTVLNVGFKRIKLK